ncbi:MAG TPA: hypothetical protein VK629_08380, partial [Steroidobacteraceae bacterium]|nr:hypothetical protein [Steroidobacteraceae bacterium]
MRTRIAKFSGALVLSALLSGCMFLAKPQAQIPIEIVPAKIASAQKRMVIVLPGQGNDLADLKKFGMAGAIQEGMPDADVALVELTLTYY